MQRLLDPGAGLDLQEYTVRQGGVVERGEQGLIPPHGTAEVLANGRGLRVVGVGETHQGNTLGQCAVGVLRGKIPVDKHQPETAEAGQFHPRVRQHHGAATGGRVGRLQGLQAGIFPLLGLAGGQRAALPARAAGAQVVPQPGRGAGGGGVQWLPHEICHQATSSSSQA